MGGSVEEEVLDAVKQKRWRIVSSSAWYKRQLGRWPGTPGRRGGRGGGLRRWRRRRARMVKRETRRGCLGGFYEWCESEGARRGPFIGRRGRARGWPVGGAVSVEALVDGMVRRAWAASVGVWVTSVARWRCRMTTNETGSSGTCGHGRRLSYPPVRQARLSEGRAWERDA
jgi:hypothetical protein